MTFIKSSLIDKRWLLCASLGSTTTLHHPDRVFASIRSQEAMTITLTKVGGLKTLDNYGNKLRFVNDEGIRAI